MCCDEDKQAFSFYDLLWLFEQPPFEPCQSELEFLTQAEYDTTFAIVWKRYFRQIRFYIAHIIEDREVEAREVAADLTQKLFINLYYAKATFDPSYIYRAARNAAYGELRRRGREIQALRRYWRGIKLEKRSEELDAPDPKPLQDESLIWQRREEALRVAIMRLPEKFCVPLILFAQGKSYKQIVKITEANEGTVKSRICRGKRLLRRKLHAYL
jgi:RNA polymerase sigma factor (sigma-70 family)